MHIYPFIFDCFPLMGLRWGLLGPIKDMFMNNLGLVILDDAVHISLLNQMVKVSE